MIWVKALKHTRNRKRKKGQTVNRRRKKRLSKYGSGNSSNLKEQVDKAKVLAGEALDKLVNDPNITFCEFVHKTRQINRAFEIMDSALELSEQMKKLKDDTA